MLISVIIPVFRENNIIKSIRDIKKALAGVKGEIIVIDGELNSSTIKKIKNKDVIKLKSKPGRGKR